MTVLVTGGTGYIGRELVKRLEDHGEQVRVLTRKPKHARDVNGDIANYTDVENAMRGCNNVFHLAAQLGHSRPYALLHEVNVVGTENVLRAALQLGVKRVVHASSVAAAEDFDSNYNKTKKEAELVVSKYQKKGITVPVMRIGPVYDDERLARVKGKWFPAPDLNVQLHLVYRPSVVDGLIKAREKGTNKVYYLADEKPVSSKALYETIMKAQEKRVTYLPGFFVPLGIHSIRGLEWLFEKTGKRFLFSHKLLQAGLLHREYDNSLAVRELDYRPVDTLATFNQIFSS